MTSSYFQDGSHDVHPLLAAAYAAVSAGSPLAHRARLTLTSLARYMRYSFWSIIHSYSFRIRPVSSLVFEIFSVKNYDVITSRSTIRLDPIRVDLDLPWYWYAFKNWHRRRTFSGIYALR